MTAPSVSASVVGSGTSGTSLSLASWTPSANDLVLVFVSIRHGATTPTVSSVSGNGITFALDTARTGTQTQERIEVWRGQVASPSTGQITVNFSTTLTAAVAVGVRIGGAKTGNNGADAIEGSVAADTGATDTAAPSVNVTTTGVDRLVVGGCSHRARTFTVGSGETSVSINNTVGTAGDETRCSVEYQTVASASTVAIDGTLNSATDWSMVALAVLPAGNNYALTTTVNSQSSTPDVADLNVARALSSSVASQSSTPDVAVLAVARALSTAISSASLTPDTVMLGFLLSLSTTVNSQSSTGDAVLSNLLALATTVNSQSSTPDVAALNVARALSTTINSLSSTGDIDFDPILTALLDHLFRLLARRSSFVLPGERTITLPAARRSFEGHLMAVAEVPKDPSEVLDFSFDYTTLLNGETISTSVWATDTGDVVVDSESETTTTTTVRVSGGTLNTKSKVKNTVTTSGGQTLIRRLVIVLQEM